MDRLEQAVVELATETRRGFDQVAAQFELIIKRMDENEERTEKRFREIGERFRETDERFREMARENAQRSREVDDRIDKLVVAIGEFIRRQNPTQT